MRALKQHGRGGRDLARERCVCVAAHEDVHVACPGAIGFLRVEVYGRVALRIKLRVRVRSNGTGRARRGERESYGSAECRSSEVGDTYRVLPEAEPEREDTNDHLIQLLKIRINEIESRGHNGNENGTDRNVNTPAINSILQIFTKDTPTYDTRQYLGVRGARMTYQ